MFRWIYKLPLRLRSLFNKESADAELNGELQFHLQEQEREFMARGMGPQEAHYAALRELGGLEQIKEECREMREVSVFENLVHDVRFAVRTLRKNPGFAFVVVLTLALGMGANTAIFSLVNSILLRQLPYPQPERLVGVWDTTCPKGGVLEYRRRLRSVEIAAYTGDTGFNLSGHGEAVRLTGSSVTANLFSVLGVQPKAGRLFRQDDELPGKSRIVILSEKLWQQQFGSDPAVLGRSIVLNDVPREIVGIMPGGFQFPAANIQLWVPVEFNTADPKSIWGAFVFTMIGRLRDGISLAQAQAEYRTVIPQAIKAYPWPMGDHYGDWSSLALLGEHSVSDVRPTLLILLIAVTLVLLIACANVANLLLARSAPRQRELAVRSALGASRRRIISQLLTESVFLAVLGGACGCLLAFVTLKILKVSLAHQVLGLQSATIDLRVLLFSGLISILTGLIFGLAPALQASRNDIEQSLRANSLAAGMNKRRSKLSSGLVVAEVALAVVLVSAAGLLIRSLWQLVQMNTGFRADHLLTARISPTPAFCRAHNDCVDFYREITESARALPGVKAVSFSDSVPLANLPTTVLAVESRPEYSANSPYQAWSFQITPSYFSAMEIPLLRGRSFTDADSAHSEPVVIVSKSLAQIFWPGEDPLGKRVKPSWQPEWRTVVGVVDDIIKYKALPGKSYSSWAMNIKGDIYFPAASGIVLPPQEMTIALRVEGNTDLPVVSRQLTAAVARINPTVPVSKIQSMDQIVSDSVSTPRSTMWLFIAFAALALTLGVLGIYSVTSYSVAQRTREIGVRMAMGAGKWQVLTMVLRQGSILTALGTALGIAIALALTRLMASFLNAVRPADPLTLLAVTVIVSGAALVATYIPSRRATRVDPTVALKYE